MRRKYFLPVVISAFLCLAICAASIFVRTNSGAENEWSPVWSSNQQYIAYECMFFQLSDLRDLDEYSYFGKNDICIFDRDKNEVRRLTTERGMSRPAWSPDGTLLAWLTGNDSVIIWDMSTNQFQKFYSGRQFHYLDGPLKWSQDGQKIFVQGDGAIFDVEQKDFLDPLPMSDSLDNCCFHWSSDGKYVAYKRVFLRDSSRYHWQVVIMQDHQTIFTSDFETGDDPLRWSPDSSILAWVAVHPTVSRYQLALTDVASRNTQFVTFNEGIIGIAEISWSPSGRQIAVRLWDELQILSLGSVISSDRDVTMQNEGINLSGSSFKGVSWSPDEKYIAYETNWEPYSQIWILEPSTHLQFSLVSRDDE